MHVHARLLRIHMRSPLYHTQHVFVQLAWLLTRAVACMAAAPGSSLHSAAHAACCIVRPCMAYTMYAQKENSHCLVCGVVPNGVYTQVQQ
jgi:hypothetical protein